MKQTPSKAPVVFNERDEKREFWQRFEMRMSAEKQMPPAVKVAAETEVKK